MSNEKQLALASVQYATDYDEQTLAPLCYKWGVANNPWNAGGVGWGNVIYPYIKSQGVVICPSDTTNVKNPVSYAYNSNLAFLTRNASATPYPLAKMTAPSMTVMFFEAWGTNVAIATETCNMNTGPTCSPSGNGQMVNNGGGTTSHNIVCQTGFLGRVANSWGALAYTCLGGSGTNYYGGSTTYPWPVNGPEGVHQDGSNYVLSDGHCKWLKGENVSPGYAAASATDKEGQTGRCAAGTQGTFTGNGDAPAATFSPI